MKLTSYRQTIMQLIILQLIKCASCGRFGLNIICINKESGRFKIIIEGQEWADRRRIKTSYLTHVSNIPLVILAKARTY